MTLHFYCSDKEWEGINLIFPREGLIYFLKKSQELLKKTFQEKITCRMDWLIFCYSLTRKVKNKKKFLLHVVYE
jgi:hypothetical protein